MTVTQEAETGPLLADGQGPGRRFVAPEKSGTPEELADEFMVRARKLRGHAGKASVQRTALLGVLLARLEGVPFEEGVSVLLNIKTGRLEKFMHGELPIPGTVERRWEALSKILDSLHAVLRPEATWRWLNTSIPALHDRTPLEAIRRGRVADVLNLVESYRDPGFH